MHCKSITDSGVADLAATLPHMCNLQIFTLNLNFCTKITEAAAAALVAAFPSSLLSASLSLRATCVTRSVQNSCEVLAAMMSWLQQLQEDPIKLQQLLTLELSQSSPTENSSGAAPARPSTPYQRMAFAMSLPCVDAVHAAEPTLLADVDEEVQNTLIRDSMHPACSVQSALFYQGAARAILVPACRPARLRPRTTQTWCGEEDRSKLHLLGSMCSSGNNATPLPALWTDLMPPGRPGNSTLPSSLEPSLGLSLPLVSRRSSAGSGVPPFKIPTLRTLQPGLLTQVERKSNRNAMAAKCLNRYPLLSLRKPREGDDKNCTY